MPELSCWDELMKPSYSALFVLLANCAHPPQPATISPTSNAYVPVSPNASTRVDIAGPEASLITFERMSGWPEPGWQVPQAIAFSPDGRWVTFLESEKHDEETALFALDRQAKEPTHVILRASDLAPGKAPMSREEELRRERERKHDKGITSYVWAKRAPLMVIPFAGDVFAHRDDGTILRLTETPEPELDPRPCDSGERIAFVRKGELFSIEVATKKELALPTGAPAGVTRGISDFNGQEEFNERHGFFWSPRCDHIVFLEVDELSVR